MSPPQEKIKQVGGVAHRLEGKVAIITGGAKGIGLACASCLGNEGAKVLVADINKEEAQKAAEQLRQDGITASAAHVDVTDKSQVDALVEHTVLTYGGLDLLVANAGIVKGAEFVDMTEADFDDVIRVNLKGVFLTGQAAARQMIEQNETEPGRGGCIITMSSLLSWPFPQLQATMPPREVSTTSPENSIASPDQYGQDRLTRRSADGTGLLRRCMALSLAPHKIRVNGIGPGSIMTDVLSSVVNDQAAMNKVLTRTPLGRVGDPIEIGQIAAFLASDAASYITGQILYADGGRMALNYTVPPPSS